jgi:hypothetical protein
MGVGILCDITVAFSHLQFLAKPRADGGRMLKWDENRTSRANARSGQKTCHIIWPPWDDDQTAV